MISQPVNLLDWGLQRAANAIEPVRSITVGGDLDGAAIEDRVEVEFSLVETARFKYTIQGLIAARSPNRLSDAYCSAALKAWRQAVLKSNGDKPSAALDLWFSHTDRVGAERPKGLADALAGNFEFKMSIGGGVEQPVVSCSTPVAAEPVTAAKKP